MSTATASPPSDVKLNEWSKKKSVRVKLDHKDWGHIHFIVSSSQTANLVFTNALNELQKRVHSEERVLSKDKTIFWLFHGEDNGHLIAGGPSNGNGNGDKTMVCELWCASSRRSFLISSRFE